MNLFRNSSNQAVKIYKKAVLPLGFVAGAIASGIKRKKLDLALFFSIEPAKAAVQTTANKIQGASLKINKRHLRSSKNFQAVVVNSGNANCFTGIPGLRDARNMACYAAQNLGIHPESVLVASTGIIGRRLPITKIKSAMPKLVKGLSSQGIDQAKMAILTTDTFTKEIAIKFAIGARPVTICGVAKGSGMIAPNMATMLGFIFTDANITKRALEKSLKMAVEGSFNCISVDNCMSTNDTVIALANGMSRNKLIDTGDGYSQFLKALNLVCLELAKLIVKDAEGATKFIRIKVDKAKDFAQAKTIALNIANSALFKTAIYGESPNFFGRVVAAVGSSGMDVKEKKLKIKVSPINKKDINVNVSVNRGNASATVYTSDLTPEYIRINAEYN